MGMRACCPNQQFANMGLDQYPFSAGVAGAAALMRFAAAAAFLLSPFYLAAVAVLAAVAAATDTTHLFSCVIDAVPSCYVWIVCCLPMYSLIST